MSDAARSGGVLPLQRRLDVANEALAEVSSRLGEALAEIGRIKNQMAQTEDELVRLNAFIAADREQMQNYENRLAAIEQRRTS